MLSAIAQGAAPKLQVGLPLPSPTLVVNQPTMAHPGAPFGPVRALRHGLCRYLENNPKVYWQRPGALSLADRLGEVLGSNE